MAKRRVTLKDVAAASGISYPTVSRILNGRLDNYPLRPETIDRVRRTARDLNYQPNRFAQMLRRKKSHIIGLSISHPPVLEGDMDQTEAWKDYGAGIGQIIAGVSSAATAAGYSLIMIPRESDTDHPLGAERYFPELIDGLLYLTPFVTRENLAHLSRFEKPVVLMSSCPEGVGLSSCDIDNRQAARDACQHLVEQGCRKILFVFPPPKECTAGIIRRAGYREIMQESGLPLDEDLSVWNCEEQEDVEQALRAAFQKHPDIDGVFLATGDITFSLSRLFERIGRPFPQRLRLACLCSGWPTSALENEITSVHVPVANIAFQSTKLLLEQIERPNVRDIVRREVPYKFVIRQSSLAPESAKVGT